MVTSAASRFWREGIRFFAETWRWFIPLVALSLYMGSSILGAVLSNMGFGQNLEAVPASVFVFWGPLGLAGIWSAFGFLTAQKLDCWIPRTRLPDPESKVPCCPDCGSPMVRWMPSQEAVESFWCCQRFPHCEGTREYKD